MSLSRTNPIEDNCTEHVSFDSYLKIVVVLYLLSFLFFLTFLYIFVPISSHSIRCLFENISSVLIAPWTLVTLQPTDLSRMLQEGVLGTLENSMREKAILSINDVIDNNPHAKIFVPIVTELVAPGYNMCGMYHNVFFSLDFVFRCGSS